MELVETRLHDASRVPPITMCGAAGSAMTNLAKWLTKPPAPYCLHPTSSIGCASSQGDSSYELSVSQRQMQTFSVQQLLATGQLLFKECLQWSAKRGQVQRKARNQPPFP